ncbi:hypothetical protein DES53_1149 [Roseimicrobium gellanilyticum]|uniref:N-acetyltransferase domain-containing protein n=1 Tax=Roseimicrobium gellanilyticum TaxID=748857 RepID=A0A366H758_9BACT|nr:hypothetical protein [Roseimicrobium gellanilyticum]RBP37271.1 hypothetical protein DES53_1149 [Roseimicrobium gellanilyticum]
MKQLSSEVRRVTSLSEADVRGLFVLFSASYEAVSLEQFTADLSAKDDVLLLCDATGAVQGFSTQVTHRFEIDGRVIRVLFSGDTIIAPEWWGTQELVRAWCRYAGRVKARHAEEALYWLLLSKGHRTYLYLPLFFHHYHPRSGAEDMTLQRFKDTVASQMFGGDYHTDSGRLEFTSSKGHLRSALADVPTARDRREHVAFFLERNPRYAEGHELVCFAEISPENMRGAARRHLQEGMRGESSEASTAAPWGKPAVC